MGACSMKKLFGEVFSMSFELSFIFLQLEIILLKFLDRA